MAEKFEHIVVDRVGTDDRVARITLNRPEKLNALAPQTLGEFETALRDLEADLSARVIILRGAGRAFSVGHDLSGTDLHVSPQTPERTFPTVDEQGRPLVYNFGTSLRQGTDIFMYFWRMAKVTIVQTHGYCLAGGMELAMMGDLVTTTTNCQFGHPGHRSIGLARNGMILPLVIGMRKAKELFYTGDAVSGTEAVELGIANYAWAHDDIDEKTIALADRVANQSADFLAVLKAGANRFYENMGIDSSVQATTQLDATAQLTQSAYEWSDRYKRDGLKEALAWRDGQYGDYGAAGK